MQSNCMILLRNVNLNMHWTLENESIKLKMKWNCGWIWLFSRKPDLPFQSIWQLWFFLNDHFCFMLSLTKQHQNHTHTHTHTHTKSRHEQRLALPCFRGTILFPAPSAVISTALRESHVWETLQSDWYLCLQTWLGIKWCRMWLSARSKREIYTPHRVMDTKHPTTKLLKRR